MPITNKDLRLEYKRDTGLDVALGITKEITPENISDEDVYIDIEGEVPYLTWLEDKLVEILKMTVDAV